MRLISIDVETACTVDGCSHQGESSCPNKHSLNPWQSRITVAAVVTQDGEERVFRGQDLVQRLQAYLETLGDYAITGHNFKFDLLHLSRHGLNISIDRWQHDSQLAAYVLTDKIPVDWLEAYEAQRRLLGSHHRKAGPHSLKTLAPYHLGVPAFWEPEDGHDDDEYVLKDARYTLQLTWHLEQRLKELNQYEFYKERQLPWTKMLLRAELRGVQIDLALLNERKIDLEIRATDLKRVLDDVWQEEHEAYFGMLLDETSAQYDSMAQKQLAKGPKDPEKVRARYKELARKAIEKLPDGIDYDSPAQMAVLLRDFRGYDITSLEGDESTGREVLERLAAEGKEDVKLYLEWRKVNKILTSFIPTYEELHVAGVIHPVYNPDTTRTGRTSSERPNMQQVPSGLKDLFKARPGYKFVGADLAAIEARLIALYSQDSVLYDLVRNGISLHDFNVRAYLGVETPVERVKELHPTERSACKNVGFALFYNAGVNRIKIAFAQKGIHLTESQCRSIHERFKKTYGAAITTANNIVDAMEQGQIIENLLGRPLKIQNPQDAYMTAFNTLIQSSASDLLLHWAHELSKVAVPVLFVHDFLCFEVPEVDAEAFERQMYAELDKIVLSGELGRMPIEAEGGVGDRWSDL